MTKIHWACAVVLLLHSVTIAGDFERGIEALDKKDYDLAIRCFNAYLQENPTSAVAFSNRGYAYANKKEYDKAIEDCAEGIRLDPKNANAYNTRGLAYFSKKEYDKAIEDFSQAVRLDPKDAYPWNNRGNAYRCQKEYDKAIEDHTQAIRLDPKNAYLFCNRGIAYFYKRAYDKAIEDFSKGIRLDPKNAYAFNNLAWALSTCPDDGVRDGKKAIEYATKACELSEWKNGDNLSTLAAAYAESGDFKEAVKRQREAIALGFEDREASEKGRLRLKRYEAGKPYRDE